MFNIEKTNLLSSLYPTTDSGYYNPLGKLIKVTAKNQRQINLTRDGITLNEMKKDLTSLIELYKEQKNNEVKEQVKNLVLLIALVQR